MPAALVINPNTSPEMTAEIAATAKRVFHPPWEARVVKAPAGPESLESWTDYHLASIALLPLLEEHPDVDGAVLACFGDPGIYMLRELAPYPVVGIAEAAMALSLMIAGSFGILAGMRRAVELMDSMVRTYGLEARYAGTQPLDMRVLDFDADRAATLNVLVSASNALRHNGAECLLLGCAGLTGFVAELQERVSMPVIDPVEAGCRMLRTLCEAGLDTSHIGLFSRPAPQRMNDLERLYSPKMAQAIKSPRE